MANPHKGEITVPRKAGGELRLKFDTNAMVEVEDAAGMDMVELFARLEAKRPSLKLMRALVYGGTRAHHPALSLTDCGDLLDEEGETLFEKMIAALSATLPEPAEADDEGGEAAGTANPPAASTGPAS